MIKDFTEVYVVTDPEGNVWRDIVASTEDRCKHDFCRSVCGLHPIDMYFSIQFFELAGLLGYKIKTLQVYKEKEDAE